MNRFSDLGMIINHRLPASHQHVPNPITPNPIPHTSRIQIAIIVTGVT
jgi:hypothetical protein